MTNITKLKFIELVQEPNNYPNSYTKTKHIIITIISKKDTFIVLKNNTVGTH